MDKMKDEWFAVPFENVKVSEKLEDLAQAANIPRVAILNPSKSCDEAMIKDCKGSIIRN